MTSTSVYFDLIARDRASSTIKGIGSAADTTSSKMQKFHKVGAAAGVALAGGLLLAGKAAISATKAAAADQLSQAKLAQTLKAAAHATDGQVASTEKWISAQEKAYGVSDEDLRPALSKLAVATGSVAKAQKLASLAMDVSAGTGKSLESVSMALAKAQNGNISGLSRLGIATKNAKGETLSLTQVTKQLSDHYKGAAANAAQTAAGKQKILSVQMQELQEQIGYALIPALQKLVDVGLKVVDWVSHNTTTVGVLIGVMGSLLAITWAVSVATKLWATYQALSTAATKAAAAAQWLLNAAMDANPIGLVVIAIAALVVGLVIAYKKSETFRNIVNGAFHAVAATATSVFNSIRRIVSSVFDWIKGHWKLLAAILGGPIVAAAVVIISNWGKIKAATSAVWNAIKSIVRGAWQAITGIVRTQIGIVLGAITGLASRVAGLAGKFLSAGKSLMNALWDGFRSAASNAGGFIGGLVTDVKNAINSALSLPLVVNFDKGPLHIHATLIPALAEGGIVTRATTALIGEAGPEAVIPLSKAGQFGLGMGMNAGGDLGTFTIVVRGPGAREQQKMLLRLKHENGGLSLGLA